MEGSRIPQSHVLKDMRDAIDILNPLESIHSRTEMRRFELENTEKVVELTNQPLQGQAFIVKPNGINAGWKSAAEIRPYGGDQQGKVPNPWSQNLNRKSGTLGVSRRRHGS